MLWEANGELKSWFPVDDSTSNYCYLDTRAIEEILGLADFDVAIWLNPTSRNVIAVEGVKVDKKEYYRQYDLTGGQTLPEPEMNTDANLGTVTVQTYDNKADLKLSKVYSKVTCNLMQAKDSTTVISSQVFTNTDTVTVTDSGIYQLIATDSNKTGMEKTSNNFSVTVVNKPMLVDGMTPVKLNASGNFVDTTLDDTEWYNYDLSQKRWANVKLKDGSYYVWIPRFAYKKDGSKIEIKFMSNTSSSLTTDGKVLDSNYRVAPAFQNGVANGFQNGEWDNDITGFWVAKYEASLDGDLPRSVSTNSGTFIKTPREAFIACRKMESVDKFFNITKATGLSEDATNTNKKLNFGIYQTDNNNIDTHLAKNSEYGAVAYLTYSDYGNTGIQSHGSSYPGNSAEDITTTTGNKYGVYGMSGGLLEITASAYNVEGIFHNGNSSTKYATTYNKGTDIAVVGDGIADVPITLTASNNKKPENTNMVFVRGGESSSGQLFGYNELSAGTAKSFRPIIIVEY